MRDSIFIQTFGNTPKIRVLDFLLENNIFDYSKSDIAKHSKISRATLDTFWDSLVKSKIIVKNRTIGRAVLFKLNTKNPLVRKLIEVDNFLTINQIPEKEIKINA